MMDNWEPWLKFFLKGVAQVSRSATENAHRILELRRTHRELIYKNIQPGQGDRITGLSFRTTYRKRAAGRATHALRLCHGGPSVGTICGIGNCENRMCSAKSASTSTPRISLCLNPRALFGNNYLDRKMIKPDVLITHGNCQPTFARVNRKADQATLTSSCGLIPEEHFAGFVQEFEIPETKVFSYEGSFFALRHMLEPFINGLESPRLLIYVPRAKSDTHHALAEFAAAGVVRYSPANNLPL